MKAILPPKSHEKQNCQKGGCIGTVDRAQGTRVEEGGRAGGVLDHLYTPPPGE